MSFLIALIVWIGIAVIAGWLGKKLEGDFQKWFMYGLCLFVWAIVFVLYQMYDDKYG